MATETAAQKKVRREKARKVRNIALIAHMAIMAGLTIWIKGVDIINAIRLASFFGTGFYQILGLVAVSAGVVFVIFALRKTFFDRFDTPMYIAGAILIACGFFALLGPNLLADFWPVIIMGAPGVVAFFANRNAYK